MNMQRLTTALFAGTLATWVGAAGAGLLTYDFSFTVAGGTLDGTSQSGQYSFDTAGLTGSGQEYRGLHGFSFQFNGVTYGPADDPSAAVNFSDGTLLGLTYAASTASPAQSISFQAGFFDLTEQSFIYTYAGETGGAGEPGNPITTVAAVPVPGTLWFAPLLAGLLAARRRRPRRSGSAPGGHRTEVMLGYTSLGALTVAAPLMIGCNETSVVHVTMPPELNPNQAAIYDPPGTYTGANPEDTTASKLIEIVARATPASAMEIAGCSDAGDCFDVTFERRSDRVGCRLYPHDGANCSITLYPQVTRQPVVWNDTPYAATVRDASGQRLSVRNRDGVEVPAIPPTLAGDKPTLLPPGSNTLEFRSEFPGVFTWEDRYIGARDRTDGKTRGATYTIQDKTIWRVIRVSARVDVVSQGLDKISAQQRRPDGTATALPLLSAFGLTAAGGTRAADLLYTPDAGATAATGVRGCPDTVTTENTNTRVCALDLAERNWNSVIKELDGNGKPTGKIILQPYR